MNLLGIRLKILIGEAGRNIPPIAPRRLNEALQSVEVTHSDEGRSGFQLSFRIGRGLFDLRDYSLLTLQALEPFKRVILIIIFNITPRTLIDGIITTHQITPGDDPGASTMTVTGEDVSVMMDLKERLRQRPRESDVQIVQNIIENSSEYSAYRFNLTIPDNIASQAREQPDDQGRKPTQSHITDLAYIRSLAERYGYVFYIEPGESRGTNEAYWGPPVRSGEHQRALSVNMGPQTNVESINFQYNALAPTKVAFIQDGNEQEPIVPSPRAPFARNPADARRLIYRQDTGRSSQEEEGTTARDRAQGIVDRSMDEAVSASGELDALRYGGLLKPRGLVDLRGAGESYDGTYYVKSVTHRINVRSGEYKQSFKLSREGLVALSRRVLRV